MPACTAAGIRLLQKMGWRQGKGIGTVDTSAAGVGTKGSTRWGRVAGVGVENTPLYALKPKDTLHGLGFDPFKVRYSSHRYCRHPSSMLLVLLFPAHQVHQGLMMKIVNFHPQLQPHTRMPKSQNMVLAYTNWTCESCLCYSPDLNIACEVHGQVCTLCLRDLLHNYTGSNAAPPPPVPAPPPPSSHICSCISVYAREACRAAWMMFSADYFGVAPLPSRDTIDAHSSGPTITRHIVMAHM